jgi:hypothetical protein
MLHRARSWLLHKRLGQIDVSDSNPSVSGWSVTRGFLSSVAADWAQAGPLSFIAALAAPLAAAPAAAGWLATAAHPKLPARVG